MDTIVCYNGFLGWAMSPTDCGAPEPMSDTPDRHAPSGLIASDPFSVRWYELTHNPGAVRTSSKVDLLDDYKHIETWVIDTFREEGGRETVFLQRIGNRGPLREMLPPRVTAAIAGQRDRATGHNRKRGAKRAMATRIARGDTLGNPEALRKARKARTRRKAVA